MFKMKKLYKYTLDSPLGKLFILADETSLYMLEYDIEERLEKQLNRLYKILPHTITERKTAPIKSLEKELGDYFCGKLKAFKTPFELIGTPFQKKVWKELLKTPYGKTQSYKSQAQKMGSPKAFRAVGNANGQNCLSIIIPCHRIIASNGSLGGYGGTLSRKQKLLELESLNYDFLRGKTLTKSGISPETLI